MSSNPLPILMFSSLTTEGAQATLDALDAGAMDFLPKRFEDISKNADEASRLLRSRVKQLAGRRPLAVKPRVSRAVAPGMVARATPTPSPAAKAPLAQPRGARPSPGASVGRALEPGELKRFSALAIGTSTGGPVALQEILTKLPGNFPLPILLVQHMPSTFTAAFASRLNKQCQIQVQEAVDGDALMPGLALLAPGGKQMVVERRGPAMVVRVHEASPGQTYKPCVDVTFESIARNLSGRTLAVILTGMGADGREGVRAIKQREGICWAQSEETCVVFGMPGAVVDAGLADRVLAIQEIAGGLLQGM